MKNYRKMIDELLQEHETEYTSKHKKITKILNFEFLQGKLYGLYEQISKETTPEEFRNIYEYRHEERTAIERKYNFELINPLYMEIEQ